MNGRHILVDERGEPVRPAAGLDSLVDPAGPEPDGVTLLWDPDDDGGVPWLVLVQGAASGALRWSWSRTTTPCRGRWGWDVMQHVAMRLIVAETETDGGHRIGRHSPPPAPGDACDCPFDAVDHGVGCVHYVPGKRVVCTCCLGTGVWGGRDCRGCQGAGAPAEPTPVTCPDCRGYATAGGYHCSTCQGRGVMPDEVAEDDCTEGPEVDVDIDDVPDEPDGVEVVAAPAPITKAFPLPAMNVEEFGEALRKAMLSFGEIGLGRRFAAGTPVTAPEPIEWTRAPDMPFPAVLLGRPWLDILDRAHAPCQVSSAGRPCQQEKGHVGPCTFTPAERPDSLAADLDERDAQMRREGALAALDELAERWRVHVGIMPGGRWHELRADIEAGRWPAPTSGEVPST